MLQQDATITRYIFLDYETENLSARYNPFTKVWCAGLIVTDAQLNIQSYLCRQWSQETISLLKQYADDSGTHWVLQNAPFEIAVSRIRGINIKPGSYDDTMTMSHCLCPGNSMYHSLDKLAERFCPELPKIKYRQSLIDAGYIADDAPKGAEFAVPFNPMMEEYNLRDVMITYRSFLGLRRALAADKKVADVYRDAFLPFTEAIVQMQSGVYVDKQKLFMFAAKLGMDIISLKNELTAKYAKVPDFKWDKENKQFVPKHSPLRWVEFNPDSDYHRIWVLMQEGWQPEEFTPQGMPKSGKDQYEVFAASNEFAEKMIQYAELCASLSQAMQLLQHSNDKGLLRANWQLNNTRTHRLSSSEPNCQNIGSAERDERNTPLRESFVPSKGCKFINIDFARIEVVMLSYMMEMAGDSRLADSIRAGKDVHTANAEMWGVSRPEAKNGIFAVTYGASAERLAMTVHIPVADATRIIEAIEERTPIIADLKKRTGTELRSYHPPVFDVHVGHNVERGIVRDIFGSRYIYSDITAKDRGLQARCERQAFNVKCQGSVGYLICRLFAEFLPFLMYHRGRVVLQVHDELVIEVPEENVEACLKDVDKMFNRDDILVTNKGSIPIRISMGAGNNWHESKSGGK